MAIGWMIALWLMLGPHSAESDVTVCLTAGGSTLTAGAKQTASAVFREAGVTIAWKRPGPRGSTVPQTSLPIELVEGVPEERLPAALAVSYPYADCSKGVTVYLDRIRSVAPDVTRESAMLAYVLVHEITHVIQGVSRHSQTGVMKARWSEQDRAAIFERRLGFEDQDLQLIRRGLATRRCGGASNLRARSGPGSADHPE
jgi:hypothetical protein